MKIGKVLRTTAIASAVAALAFGSVQSKAADGVAFLGHMSASVTSTLDVTEVSPLKFGNFSVTCAVPAACTANEASLTLSFSGARSVTGTAITPLVGASHSGVATGSDQETGSQQPGFFDITTGEGQQTIYVTFADENGNIIDNNYDNVHPNNHATLTGPTAQTFTVDTFTFDDDDSSDGYTTGGTKATDPVYGPHITTDAGGLARLRVGATLHTTATTAAYSAGRYTGNYYVMVSY